MITYFAIGTFLLLSMIYYAKLSGELIGVNWIDLVTRGLWIVALWPIVLLGVILLLIAAWFYSRKLKGGI